MTSATERLRALLDERGVEYGGDDAVVYFEDTRWYRVAAYDAPSCYGEGVLCANVTATPEQLIDETLGRRTCHVDLVGYNEREDRFQCRSCNWSVSVKRRTWPRFNYCPNCGRKVVE